MLPLNDQVKGQHSMTAIIANSIPQIKKKLSDATTRKSPKPKILKLHSSDIAYLDILIWFHKKGSKCYLTKEQWPQWLVNFGGKPIHYTKQKERWAKMRKMVLARTSHHKGSRNKEMDHCITENTILAVDNFKKANLQKTKNGASKRKKRYLEKKKTVPPLKDVQIQENKHAMNFKKLEKEDREKAQTYRYLQEAGFYPEVAVETMKNYTRLQIYNAYNAAKDKKALNLGAYMTKILNSLTKRSVV